MNETLAFSLIALVLVISPGPNSALVLKTASGKGLAEALANILGLVVATFIHGLISIFGLSAIILQSAELFFVVKLMGAGYLLFLGLKTIYGVFYSKVIVQTETFQGNKNKDKISVSQYKYILEGFLTQILNPKVSMFYLAAFPQFINFKDKSYIDAFTLVSVHASIIFIWFFIFSLFIVRLKSTATKNSHLVRGVQVFSGAVLVLFSAMLLTQKNT